jgi:membrane protease subunit HflC
VKTRTILLAILVIVVIIILSGSAFIVQEKDQVVITQFGRPIGEAIVEPGNVLQTSFDTGCQLLRKTILGMEW